MTRVKRTNKKKLLYKIPLILHPLDQTCRPEVGSYWVFLPLVLQDYFADSNRRVQKDQVQNYKLLYARENHTHTVLAFSRDLQTCDPDDREITVGENYSEVCSNIYEAFVCLCVCRLNG